MKTKNILFNLITVCTLLLGGVSNAKSNQSGDSVIAVVSGSVITKQDLNKRFNLLKRQLKRDIPKGQVDAIYKRILNDLINEEVQNQYAKNQGIVVNDSEIELAIAEIEKRNNLSSGAFYSLAHGLVNTAKSKISSEIVRQKIVDKKLRPRVVVSKGEIDRLIAGINNGKNNWEKEVYQIFISHPKNGTDKNIEKRISNVYKKFTEEGVSFYSLAQTFSESPSAKEGKDGYLGWFSSGELSPAIDEVLTTVNKGEISKPISTTAGWHIIFVADVKETEKLSNEPITEYKIFKYQVNLSKSEDKKALEKTFKDEIKTFKLLGDMEEYTLRNVDNIAYNGSGSLGWVSARNLPHNAKEDITTIKINGFTAAIKNGEIFEVYHLSDKRSVLPKKLQAYRNRLQGRILSNRLELAAKRFVRDLRRQAYVEIRL